jgi:hypothetical protein
MTRVTVAWMVVDPIVERDTQTHSGVAGIATAIPTEIVFVEIVTGNTIDGVV